ncbi:ABC transporter substrate-binding protein [Faunimonas sp. B44]|uniref:ABC transporter substrate-binding protein n=1 Tax=Faunimonas sp. B44 TaxID=3461493 RepID=UPI004044B725
MRILAAALIAGIASIQNAGAADRLTVLLDWFVNPDHAPLVVAAEKGYFADRGLDVELVPPADPSAPPRLVAARQGDIAITYQPNLYLQREQDLPIVRIGTLVATPLNALVVLADGPVKALADLKDKTIGYSVAGFEEVLLEAMLAEAGVGMQDVKLVNVNFALSPALIAGRVDAVIGAFRNFELTQLRLEGHEGTAFYPEESGVPAYDELIYVAHRDSLGDDRLKRFIEAVEQATLYLTNHPEEGLEIFLGAHPDLGDELNRRAYADTLPRFSRSPAALDRMRYARFATFLAERGLIEEARPVDEYAVALE